jgi:hypothetical protein
VKRYTRSPFIRRCLRKLGVQPEQYFLLLDFFDTLSDRKEYASRNTDVPRYTLVVIVGLIMAALGLSDAFSDHMPARLFIQGNVLITALFLLMTLPVEAVNTFLNPVEASILVHQPIRERTWFLAKLTYILSVIAMAVFPLNVIPAVAGLNLPDVRWFYPITHLITVYLLGVFIALTVCALLGFLFRVIPLNRLRSTATAMQAGMFVLILLLPLFLGRFPIPLSASANPLEWFVSLGAIGKKTFTTDVAFPGILPLLTWTVFIGLGVRSLVEGYLTKVQLLMRGGPKHRKARRRWSGTVIRWITGSPSGRAAFSFIFSMARSDWQFRLSVQPALVNFLILPLIAIAKGLGPSPFSSNVPGPVHILPHIGGMAGLVICAMLTYSDQYRAAWIFLTAPLEGIHSFVRGVFWSLWIPFSASSMLLVPLYVWTWGMSDALIFVIYSLAVGSFYVSVALFLVDGLPFANPPKQTGGFLAAPLVFAAFAVAAVIIGLQLWFVFDS